MGRGFRFIKKLGSMASFALLLALPIQGVTHTSCASTLQKSRVFVSLSYAPTFAGITDFEVGEAYDDSTRALVPYNSRDSAHVLRSDRFDWMTMDGKLTFGNSSKVAVSGSVGLKLRGGRNSNSKLATKSFQHGIITKMVNIQATLGSTS